MAKGRTSHYLRREFSELRTLSYRTKNLELTELKARPELRWLREADSQALQETLRNLDRAFINFFEKRARFPRFKKRKDERYSFRISQRVTIRGDELYCPKVGWIKLRLSREIIGTTKGASFRRDASGAWYVAITTEFDLPDLSARPVPDPQGVDLGLIDFATLSGREAIPAPKFARKAGRRIARAQRALSRRKKTSRRRQKAKAAWLSCTCRWAASEMISSTNSQRTLWAALI